MKRKRCWACETLHPRGELSPTGACAFCLKENRGKGYYISIPDDLWLADWQVKFDAVSTARERAFAREHPEAS